MFVFLLLFAKEMVPAICSVSGLYASEQFDAFCVQFPNTAERSRICKQKKAFNMIAYFQNVQFPSQQMNLADEELARLRSVSRRNLEEYLLTLRVLDYKEKTPRQRTTRTSRSAGASNAGILPQILS